MSEMTVLHSNSTGRGAATSSEQQRLQPKVETATNIIRQLATRSTIYQRNETRRTRTLAQKDDPRPAVVRVLSGLPGTRILFPPYDPSSATEQQQQQQKKAQRQHETGTTTKTVVNVNVNAAAAGAAVLEEEKEDGNVFTVHSASETDAGVQVTAAASVRGTVLSTAAAAAVGGALSETFGKGSSSSSSPFLANNNKRVPSKTPKIVPVVQHDMLAFLKKAATATVSSSTTTTTTAANHNTNAIPPSVYPKMVTTAISASFLFGTKALVEASLTGNKDEDSQVRDDDDVVLSMASIVSSAIAGGAMGTARQALGSATTSAKGLLGREVVGATLYFSSYELVKSLVLGVGAGSSDHEADGRRMRTPLWIVAVAAGGGVAGVTYEAIRAPATATVSAGTMRPFALTAAAAGQQRPMSLGLAAALRSAPAHAVLFLGYEIARGQLS